jgi:hypothetical protein
MKSKRAVVAVWLMGLVGEFACCWAGVVLEVPQGAMALLWASAGGMLTLGLALSFALRLRELESN